MSQKAVLFGLQQASLSTIPTGILENPTIKQMKIVWRCSSALGFGMMPFFLIKLKCLFVNTFLLLMAIGVLGLHGVVAATHVEVESKLDPVCVIIQLHSMEVLPVWVMLLSHRIATH